MRGGTLVLEGGARRGDLLIEAEHISAIAEEGSLRADEVLDARGLVALPGVVDPHVHCNEPGRTEWEGFSAATRGAAAGGITTILDMPLNSIPPTVDAAAFDAKRAAAERAAVVDFGLWGGIVRDDPSAMEALRDRGAVAFKAFLCDSGVPEFPRVDDLTLRAALATAGRLGLVVGAHAEDEELVVSFGVRVRRSGRRDAQAWVSSRPPVVEFSAIERLLEHVRLSPAPLHVLHASAAEAVSRVREARADGLDVSVETCPHYLVFDWDDFARDGALLKCAPPIRDAANRERLWALVLEGAIDLIASDHSPSAAAAKLTDDIWTAWGGVTGVQSLLPALLTEGVHRRGLPLERLARLVATNAAKRFGLYPRKGALRPGADADLALVDLEREWTLTREQLQARSGLSPYVGRAFRGAVVRTLVRGRTVFADGEVTAAPGSGRFVRPARPGPPPAALRSPA